MHFWVVPDSRALSSEGCLVLRTQLDAAYVLKRIHDAHAVVMRQTRLLSRQAVHTTKLAKLCLLLGAWFFFPIFFRFFFLFFFRFLVWGPPSFPPLSRGY